MKIYIKPYKCYIFLLNTKNYKIEINNVKIPNYKNSKDINLNNNFKYIKKNTYFFYLINDNNYTKEINLITDDSNCEIIIKKSAKLEKVFHLYLISQYVSKKINKHELNTRSRFKFRNIDISSNYKEIFEPIYGIKKIKKIQFSDTNKNNIISISNDNFKKNINNYNLLVLIGNNNSNNNKFKINILKQYNKLTKINTKYLKTENNLFFNSAIIENYKKCNIFDENANLEIIKLFSLGVDNYNYNEIISINKFDCTFDVIILIAFLGRYQMVHENIKNLNKQRLDNNIKLGIILVGSSNEDYTFIEKIEQKYSNVKGFIINNNPCGLKWQYGMYISRLFKPYAVIILGSDDLLSLNYINLGIKYINDGYDLIGKQKWHVINSDDPNLYEMSYSSIKKISLGTGRIYSKKLLKKCNWTIFDIFRNNGLDEYGCYIANKLNAKINNNVENDMHILSIKGNWTQMNSFEKMIKISKEYNPPLIIETNVDYNENIKFQEQYFGKHFYDLVNATQFDILLYNLKMK